MSSSRSAREEETRSFTEDGIGYSGQACGRLFIVSTKEQTLSLLEDLPEDSFAWHELHEDARLLRDLAVAEADVRGGRVRSLADARQLFEQKWKKRRSKSN